MMAGERAHDFCQLDAAAGAVGMVHAGVLSACDSLAEPGTEGGRVSEGALLPDRERTFWTMTAWDSEESMRAYMISGAHKQAMPKLMHWCDEASVAHWVQEETALPSWEQADERMRREGRASKVLHPSATHATLSFKVPRTTGNARIRPA